MGGDALIRGEIMANKKDKFHNNSGIARITLILLIAVLIMIIIIAVPSLIQFNRDRDSVGCKNAITTAKRQLAIEGMTGKSLSTSKDASKFISYVMSDGNDLCPTDGTIYIIKSGSTTDSSYRLICGIHGDTKEKTQLNASYALSQIEDKLDTVKKKNENVPEEIVITMNGSSFVAHKTMENKGYRTGDRDKKAKAYYMVEDGEVTYFTYVDKDHCANYTKKDGWTGDAFK